EVRGGLESVHKSSHSHTSAISHHRLESCVYGNPLRHQAEKYQEKEAVRQVSGEVQGLLDLCASESGRRGAVKSAAMGDERGGEGDDAGKAERYDRMLLGRAAAEADPALRRSRLREAASRPDEQPFL